MVQRSERMVLIALALVVIAGWGLTRIPTGFIPTEDQGYVMVSVQLPDGASLERTERVMDEVVRISQEIPGVDHAIAVGGISPLDNSASLANAGIIYLTLKDWGERGKSENLKNIYLGLSKKLAQLQDASTMVLIPPPIQGLGLSGGFQMQVELTDGSYDFTRLQQSADAVVAGARSNRVIQVAFTPFRAQVPQFTVTVDRSQAQTLGVPVGDVYDTLQAYLGSSYVNLFTKFGHNFMVFAQADAKHRLTADDIKHYYVPSQSGEMVPLGHAGRHQIHPGTGIDLALQPVPLGHHQRLGGGRLQFRPGTAMPCKKLPTGRWVRDWPLNGPPCPTRKNWPAVPPGCIFVLGILLVYLVLAGQYESWITPGAVILAVPLALLGTVGALLVLGVANNIYVQIGLVLLIALSAKNAILIVEMAREGRAAGKSILDATIEAAQVRFRPIMMTSFVFILGVMPLVLASGAGASARKSLGIAVASGMFASTCLAVLFVPSFFVVLQKFAERKGAKAPASGTAGQTLSFQNNNVKQTASKIATEIAKRVEGAK